MNEAERVEVLAPVVGYDDESDYGDPKVEEVELKKARPQARGRSFSGGWGCGWMRKTSRVKMMEVGKDGEQAGGSSRKARRIHVKLPSMSWKAGRKAREEKFEHWMGDC